GGVAVLVPEAGGGGGRGYGLLASVRGVGRGGGRRRPAVRVGAGQSVVPALRDHGRGGGRGGEHVAGMILLLDRRGRRVSAEYRALGLGGWLRRWRRCGGPSSGTP